MNKTTKYLSMLAVLLLESLMSASKAYADMPMPFSRPVSGGNSEENIVLIGGGIVVGVVALISWLVIRAIRKKKDDINK